MFLLGKSFLKGNGSTMMKKELIGILPMMELIGIRQRTVSLYGKGMKRNLKLAPKHTMTKCMMAMTKTMKMKNSLTRFHPRGLVLVLHLLESLLRLQSLAGPQDLQYQRTMKISSCMVKIVLISSKKTKF